MMRNWIFSKCRAVNTDSSLAATTPVGLAGGIGSARDAIFEMAPDRFIWSSNLTRERANFAASRIELADLVCGVKCEILITGFATTSKVSKNRKLLKSRNFTTQFYAYLLQGRVIIS